jgi:hypothetical protein
VTRNDPSWGEMISAETEAYSLLITTNPQLTVDRQQDGFRLSRNPLIRRGMIVERSNLRLKRFVSSAK